ncbi:MAG: cysteine--tRNA ligase, partial [Gemmataceae bacterium]|nr:cysteine--tRNA ligase [Gemmataceae bacterium]
PGDFALWKGAKPGEPPEVQYDSPWGKGRPGWHIECSAMATRLLGETLDIHGGGLDLQFPHHENELAQSESYSDKPFARVWMHNGLLKMGHNKMAGSVGNVINVADALCHMSGEALRFFTLNTHYRSPIDLGEWKAEKPLPEGMLAAKAAFDTFLRFAERVKLVLGTDYAEVQAPTTALPNRSFKFPKFGELHTRFREHMDDDFNTGGVTGVLFELVTGLNRLVDTAKLEDPGAKNPEATAEFAEGAALVKEIAQVLGLTLAPRPTTPLGRDGELTAGLIQLIVDVRSTLRAEAKKIPGKDDPTKKMLFDQSTAIREQLGKLGVTLEDRPGGTTWRVG